MVRSFASVGPGEDACRQPLVAYPPCVSLGVDEHEEATRLGDAGGASGG